MEVLGKNMGNAIAIFLAGKVMVNLQKKAFAEFKQGNFKDLDMVHHLTAGFKSFATEMCYVGLDEMRQACGGAGFLLTAGLSDWWSDIAPFPTFEGVNPVMAQQASRLIFKSADKVSKGKQPLPLFGYLAKLDELIASKSTATTVEQFLDIDYIERTLAVRAAHAIFDLRA